MKFRNAFAFALLVALAACASSETKPEPSRDQVEAQASPTPAADEAAVEQSVKKKHEHLNITLDQALGKLAEFYEVSQAPAEHGHPVSMARNKRTKGVLKAFGDPQKLREVQFTLTLDARGVYANDDIGVLGNVLKSAAPDWKDGETWLRKTVSTIADEPVEKTAHGVTVNVKKISIAHLVVVKIN